MKKTLYIQMDNTSLPEGCGEDVEVLDCRCINDFCSLIGDRLVGDLKDENGRPLYRLINPVGKLLMDFKTVNEEAFNGLIAMWYDYLGELLHKGKLESDLMIRFPQTYIDWLLQNDNTYYNNVGKELHNKNGAIIIPSEDVIDDIMASLTYKINNFLQEKKDDISFVVFSNPLIRNSSFVVKRVKIDDMEFLRYDCWKENTRAKDKDKTIESQIENTKVAFQNSLSELTSQAINIDLSSYDDLMHFGCFTADAKTGSCKTSGSFIFHCKKLLWLIGIKDENKLNNSIWNQPYSFFENLLQPYGFHAQTFDDKFCYKASLELEINDYLVIFGFKANKRDVISFDSHPLALRVIAIYKGKSNFYSTYGPHNLYFTNEEGKKCFHVCNEHEDRSADIEGKINCYGH